MDAVLAARVERNLDRTASALFAGACAFAGYQWFATFTAGIPLLLEAAAVGGFAYLAGLRSLAAVEREQPRLPVPMFDLRPLQEESFSELLLTERYESAEAEPQNLLELTDVLAELEPDSRVVSLFDPAAMPTAGQLDQRIQRHLGAADRRQSSELPDASQALHDALAQLRRSLP